MKKFWVKFPRICWFNLLVVLLLCTGVGSLLVKLFYL